MSSTHRNMSLLTCEKKMVPGDIASTPLHWFMQILHWQPPTKPSPLSRASRASRALRTLAILLEKNTFELRQQTMKTHVGNWHWLKYDKQLFKWYTAAAAAKCLFAIFRQGMTATLNRLTWADQLYILYQDWNLQLYIFWVLRVSLLLSARPYWMIISSFERLYRVY